jgi:DNA (cytosine-5)-methyltransferase 1
MAAVDLFCGAGGLTRGLLDAGIVVRLGIDLDPDCKHPFEANNKGARCLIADVSKVDAATLKQGWRRGEIRVLAGCAPCQPFSTYNQGRDTRSDGQWALLRDFDRLVGECQPHVVTIENVSSLARHHVFKEFCQALAAQKYKIGWAVLDCRDYGVPQARKRLVLIGSRLGLPSMPRPITAMNAEWRTVRQSICGLARLKQGQSDPKDPIHVASRLTSRNLERIRASVPGGSWRDWPPHLIAPCHKKKTGRSYPAVYGRMEWDAPAPTLTGQCYGFGNGRFGHPEQDRGISLREAAILQSFPKSYSFVQDSQPVCMTSVGLMIGNAVPPLLGKAVGIAIKEHVIAHVR